MYHVSCNIISVYRIYYVLFVVIHYKLIFLVLFLFFFFGVASHGSHDLLACRLSRPDEVNPSSTDVRIFLFRI